MIINKKLLLTLGAGVIAASYASSAFAVEPCKMYLKVEAGYGMGAPKQKYAYNYAPAKGATLAGDVVNAKTNAATGTLMGFTAKKQLKGFNGDIGLGYNMTDAVRGDIAFGYSKLKNKGKFGDKTDGISNDFYLDVQMMNLMASVYYDFNNSTDFTPYAGIGIGADRVKDKITVYTPSPALVAANSTGTTFSTAVTSANAFFSSVPYTSSTAPDATKPGPKKGSSKTSFAYQGELGVSYKMSDGVYVTLAYKLKNIEKYNKFGGTVNDGYAYGIITVANAGTPITASASNGYAGVSNIHTTKRTFLHSLNAGLRVEF